MIRTNPPLFQLLDPRLYRQLSLHPTTKSLLEAEFYAQHKDTLEKLVNSSQTLTQEPKPAIEKKNLKIVSWNIEKGKNLSGILKTLQTEKELTDPDILVLIEVDMGMFRSGNRNIALEIAQALGMNGIYHTNYLELSLGDQEEQSIIAAQGLAASNTIGLHGNAILFRGELLSHQAISLPDCLDPMTSFQKRCGANKASLAIIQTPQLGPVSIVGVHLDIDTTIECRTLQAQFLSQYLQATKIPEPIIMCGDFNTTTLDRSQRYRLLKEGGWLMLRREEPLRRQFLEPWNREPLFQFLEKDGFLYKPYNILSIPTAFYPYYRLKILEKAVPSWSLPLIQWKFSRLPWPGLPLELDWFFIKGIPAATQARPAIVEVESISPNRISDHLPLILNLRR